MGRNGYFAIHDNYDFVIYMNSFICTSCHEEKPGSERWRHNQLKCIDCKLAYQKEQNQKAYKRRGHENEPAWDVSLSQRTRSEYEQRQLAKAKTGIISAILRIMG
jgi:hypothetical protein